MDTGFALDLELEECGLLDTTGLIGTVVDAIGVEATVTGGDDEMGGVELGATEAVDVVVFVEEVVADDIVVDVEEVVDDVDVVFGAPQFAPSPLEYDVPGAQEIGPQSAAIAAPGTNVATVGVCPRLFPRSS